MNLKRINCENFDKRLFSRGLSGLLGFKGGPAATTTGSVGIFNLESSIIERIHVVEAAAVEQVKAVGGKDDGDAVAGEHLVALSRQSHSHRVLQAGATTALNGQPEATSGRGIMLRQQTPELTDGRVGELNHEREMRGENLVCFPQQTFRCKCYAMTHRLNCSKYVKNPHSS
mgnify:CR=1 FL=1